jgi:hypothetical protein
MTKLTMVDLAIKAATQTMRYYEQHAPKEKAAKVAYEEYKQGYMAGWRAAMKRRSKP